MVDVRTSREPSLFSISKRCCSMTMSRSPGPYCIFFSSRAQKVSMGVPAGVICSSEKRPSQRRPARMRERVASS